MSALLLGAAVTRYRVTDRSAASLTTAVVGFLLEPS